jgi:hypothetical protein
MLLEEGDGNPSLVSTLSSAWAGPRSPSVAPSHLSHPLRGVRQRRDGCGRNKGCRICDIVRRKVRRDAECCSLKSAVRQNVRFVPPIAGADDLMPPIICSGPDDDLGDLL